MEFRDKFAQKTSIIRVNYILKVLRTIFKGKVSIADPDSFKDKIRQMQKAAAVKTGLRKQKSLLSSMSKSQKSGFTAPSETENTEGENDSHLMDDDDFDNQTNLSLKMRNDPVLNGLSTMFEEMQAEIENAS